MKSHRRITGRRGVFALAVLVCAFAFAYAPAGALAGSGSSTLPRRLQHPLAVVTKPAVPGLMFDFSGHTFVTDSRGSFLIPKELLPYELAVPSIGLAAVVKRLHLHESVSKGGVVYKLERLYQRFHTIEPGTQGRVVLAALNAYVPVRFQLLDRFGQPVDPGLFQSMTLKRIDGAVFTLDRRQLYGGPVMFRASRVVPLTGGLVSKALDYRIQSVMIGGNNVVNRAQQAFTPLTRRTMKVRVLFYSAKISASDRLFGFGIGSGIKLVFPDGAVQNVSFGNGHKLLLSALPRGNYRVSVHSWGLSAAQPLAITRDQVVELKVLSYLDIIVLITSVITIGVGLVVVGRSPGRRAAANAEVATTLVESSAPAEESTVVATVQPQEAEGPRERPRTPKRKPRPSPKPIPTPAPVAAGTPPLPQFPPPRGNR
jgi:hypothetical protein